MSDRTIFASLFKIPSKAESTYVQLLQDRKHFVGIKLRSSFPWISQVKLTQMPFNMTKTPLSNLGATALCCIFNIGHENMHYVNSNHKNHSSCQVYEGRSCHHSTCLPVPQSYKIKSIQSFEGENHNVSEPGKQHQKNPTNNPTPSICRVVFIKSHILQPHKKSTVSQPLQNQKRSLVGSSCSNTRQGKKRRNKPNPIGDVETHN